MLLFYVHTRKLFVAATLFLLMVLALPAQTPGSWGAGFNSTGGATLRGYIKGASIASNLLLELEPLTGLGLPARTQIESQGAFVFVNIRPGQYQLKVVDMYGNIVHAQFVDVHRSNSITTVQLPERKVQSPVNGTISMARLQHKVPKEARREFRRAEKAHDKGDIEKSLKHLAKAVKIDPQYFEAQINLGVRLMQTGSPEDALAAFEKAIALDPHMSAPYANSGAALLMMGRPAEAETVARKAVDLDPLNTRAQYVLGISLIDQGKDINEAVAALERASEDIESARLALAQCYARQGNLDEARGAIEGYLATPSPEHREAAEKMLVQLGAVAKSN
jgi:tetratricopeptide (TPR) repeat protein